MNKKINKAIVIIMLIIILTMQILVIQNKVYATNEEKTIYIVGDCGKLLTYDGKKIITTYAAHNEDGIKYPAYCLNVNLDGVGEAGSYAVIAKEKINDIGLWRRIINGYPYKTLEELGVETEEEAYTATKQAIYCYLYDRGAENYGAIGEAGERTLRALNLIIENANNSDEAQISNTVDIKAERNYWEEDSNNKKYVSKTYFLENRQKIKEYSVILNGNIPEGAIITDENNNEKGTFMPGEKFKVLIPISSLKNQGKFSIEIDTEMKTKFVLYGEAPREDLQDYAVTMYEYEETNGKYEEEYVKNETTIKILKQDKESKEPLQGTEFIILDQDKNEKYANLITDENGEITLKDILPGKYYIKEVKAKDGYILYEEPIEVDVKFNEKATITLNNAKENKVEKNNNIKEIEVENSSKTEIKEVEEKVKEVRKLPVTGM